MIIPITERPLRVLILLKAQRHDPALIRCLAVTDLPSESGLSGGSQLTAKLKARFWWCLWVS